MIYPQIVNLIADSQLSEIFQANSQHAGELVLRLIIAVASIFSIVQFIYARNSNRKDYYFSFLSVGITVFLLSFLLSNVKLEMGFALGLFAIFGIIRYRTDAIPIKEMTYMFVVIAVAVINALSNTQVSYLQLLITDGVILGCLAILEKVLSTRTEQEITLIYEKIENIHQANKELLLADLRNRTGLHVHRFEIKRIDFLRDTAELQVFYYKSNNSKEKQDEFSQQHHTNTNNHKINQIAQKTSLNSVMYE